MYKCEEMTMKLKYGGYVLLAMLVFSGCTPQDINQLNSLGKLVKLNLPTKGLAKNKVSSANKNYMQYYPTPKHNCDYYESRFGPYSSPAKACRRIEYSRPKCLKLERRWAYAPIVVAPASACRNAHKQDMWTIDAYDKTDYECFKWVDISMIEYNKCMKKSKNKRR